MLKLRESITIVSGRVNDIEIGIQLDM
jgi:hypothetical protein